MEDLKEMTNNELKLTNGGIVWVPILIYAGKAVAAGAAAYLGHEVADGVVRGVAGGEEGPCID